MNDLCRVFWDYQNKRERFLNKGRREKKNSSFFGSLQITFSPQRIISLKCHLLAMPKSVTAVEMCTGAVRGQESDWVINQACPSKAWNREVLFLILQTAPVTSQSIYGKWSCFKLQSQKLFPSENSNYFLLIVQIAYPMETPCNLRTWAG